MSGRSKRRTIDYLTEGGRSKRRTIDCLTEGGRSIFRRRRFGSVERRQGVGTYRWISDGMLRASNIRFRLWFRAVCWLIFIFLGMLARNTRGISRTSILKTDTREIAMGVRVIDSSQQLRRVHNYTRYAGYFLVITSVYAICSYN